MDRRSFLAAGGGLGLIYTRNGERVVINSAADVARLDARAAAVLREAAVLRDITVRNNDFGLGGDDLNGRDMVYDGSGSGNCFEGNVTISPNLPADGGTFAACPGPAQNTLDPAVLPEALSWVAGSVDDPATFEANWLRHPHKPRPGVQPLERFDSN